MKCPHCGEEIEAADILKAAEALKPEPGGPSERKRRAEHLRNLRRRTVRRMRRQR